MRATLAALALVALVLQPAAPGDIRRIVKGDDIVPRPGYPPKTSIKEAPWKLEEIDRELRAQPRPPPRRDRQRARPGESGTIATWRIATRAFAPTRVAPPGGRRAEAGGLRVARGGTPAVARRRGRSDRGGRDRAEVISGAAVGAL